MDERDIRVILQGTTTGGRRPRPADEFWRDFEARAEGAQRLGVNDSPPVEARRIAPAKLAAWLSGPAIAVAAMLVAMFGMQSAAIASPDAIQSYEMGEDVEYGGVMILNDEESQATILWIVDMEDQEDHGEEVD